MIVFDVAPPSASDHPFEDRYTHLLENISITSPFLLSFLYFILQLIYFVLCDYFVDILYIPAPRIFVEGKLQITKSILQIINDEGEGVVFRRPGSLYEHGRSTSLVKYKVFLNKFIINMIYFHCINKLFPVFAGG